MSQTLPETSGPATRHPVLEAYRTKAGAFLRARGNKAEALTVSFGSRSLSLSVFERQVVWDVLCQGQAPAADWQDLVCTGVALELGILFAEQGLQRPEASDDLRQAALAEIEQAIALSRGILDGLQRAMDGMLATGNVDEAKRITAYRSKLGQILQEARAALPKSFADEPPEPEKPAQTEEAPAPHDAAGSEASLPVPAVAAEPAPSPAPPAPSISIPPASPRVAPFLDRAAAFLGSHSRRDRELSISFGARTLKLPQWQTQALWRLVDEKALDPDAWQTLGVEMGAVQMAVLAEIETLTRQGANAAAKSGALHDLEDAVEVAQGVLDRARTVANTAVTQGEVDLAKKLTACRGSLIDTLRDSRRVRETGMLDGNAPPQAAAPPADLAAAPPRPGLEPERVTPEAEQAAPVEAAAEPSPPEPVPPSPPLLPYLDRTKAFVDSQEREEQAVTLACGSRTVKLPPWQSQALWHLADGKVLDFGAVDGLGVEAAALQLAVLETLDTLGREDLDEPTRLAAQDDLARLLGLVHSTVERLRAVTNAAVLHGRTEESKRLTACRSSLAETVREARRLHDSVVPVEDAQAPAPVHPDHGLAAPLPPSTASDAPPAEATEEEAEEETEEPGHPHHGITALRRRRREAERVRRKRIKILSLVLGGLAAIWLLAVMLPAALSSKMRVFRPDDFRSWPAVVRVVARPPSLFLVVEADRWKQMELSERERVVKAIGDLISPEGYTGVAISSSDGEVVGRWLRNTGATVIRDSDRPPS